jgi:hypothetical protein
VVVFLEDFQNKEQVFQTQVYPCHEDGTEVRSALLHSLTVWL